MVNTSSLADGLDVFKRTVRAAKWEYALAQTKCSPRKGVAQNKHETKEEGWTCASLSPQLKQRCIYDKKRENEPYAIAYVSADERAKGS